MPLFLRHYDIFATDWLEKSPPNEPPWTTGDTIKLSGILAAHGFDLLDVSSTGLHPAQRIVHGTTANFAYHAQFVEAVKKTRGIETSIALLDVAVGEINNGPIAEEVLQRGRSDIVFVGGQFQEDPASVLTFAEQLGVCIKVANQISWGVGLGTSGRGRRSVFKVNE